MRSSGFLVRPLLFSVRGAACFAFYGIAVSVNPTYKYNFSEMAIQCKKVLSNMVKTCDKQCRFYG